MCVFWLGAGKEVSGSNRGGVFVATDAKTEGHEKRVM